MLRVFDGYDPAHLREAGRVIRNGGVVAIPTETVYGLAADASDAQAVGRIFTIKGRSSDNPLITHIASPDDVLRLCTHMPETAKTLARRFWPGALTLVLPSNGAVCGKVTAGLDTVAVRCPAHPVTRELIRTAERPLAAPSANPSGRPSPTSAAHVLADYPGGTQGLYGVVDGGACAVGLESAVVDCSGEVPVLLRHGGISAEDLRQAVPGLIIQTRPVNGVIRSPGQKFRHYAPVTPMILLPGKLEDAVRTVESDKRKTGVLCPDYEGQAFARAVTYGTAPDEMAARLFGAIRQADASGAEVLYARLPDGDGLISAVRDRLHRAAGL
jgi:L-threonylcarbamoyladenylate synthase